jgi:hypothetical protein
MPKRIQLSRRKGWRMPPNTVSVARPGKWGNPFRVGKDAANAAQAVALFRDWAIAPYGSVPDPTELRGKNLACWCPLDQPCHADVLLELANREDQSND